MLKPYLLLAGFALAAKALYSQQPAEPEGTRLLRFPATNGRAIVFSYADQLYTVPSDGGVARRLTDGPGYAIFPRFSPDGSQLAFTAQYDGNTEVYLMPAGGGTPRRLTFTAAVARDDLSDRMGPNNIVLAWKNRSQEVVFRSRMRSFNPFNGQPFAVSLDADLPAPLPVPRSGFLSFSPDDSKMAYNRIFREFRTWKDYRGGQADDIWIYDFKTGAIEDITNNPAQDIIPMWGPDNRIYFLSDRDKRMNLYSYDLGTHATVQHTHFSDYDIKFPSIGPGSVVFEQAGYIWSYDLRSGSVRKVPISVREDFATSRRVTENVAAFIQGAALAPDGKRAVVTARGALFTVPAKDGPTRPLTAKSGVHERDGAWSPDGKWIAYISDASGENELYIRSQDGLGAPVKLTSGADSYYFAPRWSPDSKKLLWTDRLQRLRFIDVETKAVTVVDTAAAAEIRQFAWSPDSAWIAWARPETDSLSKIVLYSVAAGTRIEATDGWYDSHAPAFSEDGKFLLFASARDFQPSVSDLELDHVYQNLERIYLIALSKDTESPLKPKDDEVDVSAPAPKPEGKADGKPAAKAGAKAVAVTVDPDGLRERIIGLPIKPSNYASIRSVGEKIYYLREDSEPQVVSDTPRPRSSALAVYDLKEEKETELGRVSSYEISADGKRMLVRAHGDLAVIELPAAKLEIKDKVPTDGLVLTIDRHAEWAEIYDESWRQMRDFFYSPTLNGVDWPAMRSKYAALVPYAQTRYDLTYLVGELIGEIHSGHTYVGGGDLPAAPRVPVGLLGAQLSRDPASRAYRIDRILPGENWAAETRSPLTEVGVKVSVGDYILAVDGTPVRDLANIYSALVGKVGSQVVLRVNSKPVEEGAHAVTVVPIGDEAPLYYYAWVKHNTDYVSEKSGGQVGYIHVPDMGYAGLNEFAKHFYPQLSKKALIIDDRGNGGGFVSPMIIERLARELVMFQKARNSAPVTNPRDMQLGPKVVLMDEFSASDGDIFPYRFRSDHLGTLIGKRSWGGVVGIRGTLPIVDGGFLNKPEFGPYSKDGTGWPIEGHGVDPDIVVDNDPAKEFAGIDQQLDRAIAEILAQLKTSAQPIPTPPPWPDRS